MECSVQDEARSWAERSIELHHRGDYDGADTALDHALRLDPPHHSAPVSPRPFRRQSWRMGSGAQAAINLINYAHRPGDHDREVFASYYTQTVGPLVFEGQRDPRDRLQYLPDDFFGWRTVLDLGGNFGGMLHALSGQVFWGVGTDYDPRMINAATSIYRRRGLGDLTFYVHDLERDPLELLHDFLDPGVCDIVFLLSVCAHIRNWREVIAFCGNLGPTLLFEANGHEHQQWGQLRALDRAYDQVRILADRGAPGIGARRLILCEGARGGS